MTANQLLKRITQWQSRLNHLGIASFQIKSLNIASNIPGGEGAQAAVITSEHYDSVEFWFKPHFLSADFSKRELDETIIHEWLHVAWRDLDFINRTPEDWMPPSGYNDWEKQTNHETEGLIDRLARQLCDLWYDSQ